MRQRKYLFLLLPLATATTSNHTAPVQLIIDTDMSIDCDDVGAVCAAHALADTGDVDILAILHNTGLPTGIGAVSVLNHYYGRDDILLGAYKGKFGADDPGVYVNDLVDNFPSPVKNYTQVEDAVTVYRRTLAAADDNSVVISSIGFLQNLRDLLDSPADDISTLTGAELVVQKVKLISMMGGNYPGTSLLMPFKDLVWKTFIGALDPLVLIAVIRCTLAILGVGEYNFSCGYDSGDWKYKEDHRADCHGSAHDVVNFLTQENIKTVFTGFNVGVDVRTGGVMTNFTSTDNPCRRAYINEVGAGKNRPSWDIIATLYGIQGGGASHFTQEGKGGRNVVDTSGRNHWQKGEDQDYNQTYQVLHNATAVESYIDELFCTPPRFHTDD